MAPVSLLLSSQEHVVLFLECYGRLSVVAGVDDGVLGQGQQLIADCHYKLSVVAVGEVSPSYASTEQRVAAEEHLLGRQVICKATG